MRDYPEELLRFNVDRNMDEQEFNLETASLNILEELLEAHGIGDNKDRSYAKSIYKEFIILKEQVQRIDPDNIRVVEAPDMVDAFCDIQTFAFGEVLKQGYDPIIAMDECAKVINSRVGTIVDGKFTKDKSPEAQLKWYHTDYAIAKI